MAKVKTEKQSHITDYEVPSGWVVELNFFDMTGEKSKTIGTSAKMYHLEIQSSKDGKLYQLYSEYGPTGKVAARDWRYFAEDRTAAEAEFNSIKKSKLKKGYVEIDVAQRALGSDEAKKHTKAVILKNADAVPTKPSTMTTAQQAIVSLFFNAQDTWIAQTLKCPLGQLTNNQIDLGRAALNEAKVIINKHKSISDDNMKELVRLTNSFYGLIPHNLGAGARGQMLDLRLDTLDKIVAKETDLDTLLDAKQVNAVLKADSTLDDKYKSLNCDFGEVDQNSDLWRFLVSYFSDSKVHGHGFHSSRVTRIWTMKRKDNKEAAFTKNMEAIAKQAGSHTFATDTADLSGGKSKLWTPDKRPDLSKEDAELYKRANVWLCWHGTRSANLVGITRRGLLIRPSGAIYTGSLFGDGKYFAWQSTKSLNYSDGGYWTGGRADKRYMFLLDVAFGKMHHTWSNQFFSKPPKGFHSVYGSSGRGSSLRNDEMITYDMDDNDNQSGIRYLFEITG
jgi:predicted DNA-binding WGR domain protein